MESLFLDLRNRSARITTGEVWEDDQLVFSRWGKEVVEYYNKGNDEPYEEISNPSII